MAMLAEDLLLLAFDEEQPVVPAQWRGRLTAGLLAALLGECSLRGRIRASEATIRILDSDATGDDLLDNVLAAVAGTRELWSPLEWLQLLRDRIPDVEGRLVDRLVEAESLARAQGGLIATQQRPLPADLHAIDDRRRVGEPVSPTELLRLEAHLQRRRRLLVVQRLRAILFNGDVCDERYRLLISLPRAMKLLQRLYDRDEARQIRHSVRTLTAGEPLGQAVDRARWARATRSTPGVVGKTPPWARY